MGATVFWKLVHHELYSTANRRKNKKLKFSRNWTVGYWIAIVLLFFLIMTIVKLKTDFQLVNTWFVTLGLPYMIFFWGFGLVKKEWDNETQGWWLTLPYTRTTLLGAKLVANMLQICLVLLSLFILSLIYSFYLELIQGAFNGQEMVHFIIIGLNWFILLGLFSPFIMSLGQFLAIANFTAIRVIMPILWFIFMGIGSVFYWGIPLFNQLFAQMAGEKAVTFFPYSYVVFIPIFISIVCSFLILKLSAYLLDKKIA